MGESSMSEQQDKPYEGDTVNDGATIAGKTSRWVKAGMLGLAGTSGHDRCGIYDGESRHPGGGGLRYEGNR